MSLISLPIVEIHEFGQTIRVAANCLTANGVNLGETERPALSLAFQGQPTAQLTRIHAPGDGALVATIAARSAPHAHAQEARTRWGLQAEALVRGPPAKRTRPSPPTWAPPNGTVEAHVTQIPNKLG